MLKIGTLFSGGLAAVEWAMKYEEFEHEVVFACEWDKYARQSYLAFHGEPTSCFYEDVSDMKGHKYLDTIDLMCWGSPCQDLSLAGKRKGFDGEKSSLFREGARIMGEVMPKAFIFENVKGLLSSNGGADYKEVEKTFRELGYLMAMKVVNAKEQGTAQNRERVFVVGFLDVGQYHDFTFAESVPLTKRLRDYLEDDVDEKYYLSEKMIKGFIHKDNNFQGSFSVKDIENDVANCLDTKEGNRRTNNFISPELNQIGELDIKDADSTKRVYSADGICPTLTTIQGGNLQPKVLLPLSDEIGTFEEWYKDTKDYGGTKEEYDRLAYSIQVKSATACGYEVATENDSINFTHPNSKTRRGRVGKGVAQTLDCACNQGVIETLSVAQRGRYVHDNIEQQIEVSNHIANSITTVQKDSMVLEVYETQSFRIRRLTPHECFRLMGMRDCDIVLVNSNSQSYKIAGNGIEIESMRSIIRQLYRPVKSSLSLF